MENNRNPLNGYRYDVREPGIETGVEQMRKLVKNSSSENAKADSAQDKAIKANKNEIKKVANDLNSLKNNVYTKSQADSKFLTEHQSLEDYAKKADVYTKEEVDAKIPEDVDLTGYAKEEYVDNKISELIAGAPDELDTLKEAADAIKTNIDSISTIAAGLDAKANAADVYTKDEVDAKIEPLAVKTEVDTLIDQEAAARESLANEVSNKANTADVYNKNEVDTKIEPLAVKTAVDELINQESSAREALATEVTKKVDWVESDGGRKHIVLPNHNNLLGTDTEGGTYNLAMVSKWNVADFGTSKLHMNLNSVDGNVTINDDKQIATVDQIPDVSGFALASDVETALAGKANTTDLDAKANASDVYTKSEVDGLIPDVSEKVDWVESTPGRKHVVLANHDSILGTDTTGGTYNVAMVSKWNVADFGSSKLHMNLNSLDGNVTINDDKTIATVDQIPEVDNFATKEELQNAIAGIALPDMEQYYKKDEVDAMLAEKQAEIDAILVNFNKLKEIVGDLGGAVEYNIPEDGEFTKMLNKSGVIKLTEDVESNTYTGGINSKNITTLNLGGKTLTTIAESVVNPTIMAKGKQQITITGNGTINANGHVAIESAGKDAIINLGGTAFGKPTYVTDRSGGELIYCYQGTINITNGVFKNNGEDKGFMINCYDANYQNGTAKIVITGGKFYDFDPGNNSAEGPGTSFLADGYESVASTVVEDGVEHTVYTVKKIS